LCAVQGRHTADNCIRVVHKVRRAAWRVLLLFVDSGQGEGRKAVDGRQSGVCVHHCDAWAMPSAAIGLVAPGRADRRRGAREARSEWQLLIKVARAQAQHPPQNLLSARPLPDLLGRLLRVRVAADKADGRVLAVHLLTEVATRGRRCCRCRHHRRAGHVPAAEAERLTVANDGIHACLCKTLVQVLQFCWWPALHEGLCACAQICSGPRDGGCAGLLLAKASKPTWSQKYVLWG
jgi:hypothetical protein